VGLKAILIVFLIVSLSAMVLFFNNILRPFESFFYTLFGILLVSFATLIRFKKKALDLDQVRFKKLNINDDDQINAKVKWNCDIEICHYITLVRDRDIPPEISTHKTLRKRYEDNPAYSDGYYFIYDGEKIIGDLSMQIDPSHLFKEVKGTGWLGLAIGEKEYWGTGVAIKAMEFFEQLAVTKGLVRIEIGVFEFNARAYSFYKKLGYVELGRVKEITYWHGRYWDDIRMEKIL
jgi:RimJ/RimL family protein N-acetyltransferase